MKVTNVEGDYLVDATNQTDGDEPRIVTCLPTMRSADTMPFHMVKMSGWSSSKGNLDSKVAAWDSASPMLSPAPFNETGRVAALRNLRRDVQDFALAMQLQHGVGRQSVLRIVQIRKADQDAGVEQNRHYS